MSFNAVLGHRNQTSLASVAHADDWMGDRRESSAWPSVTADKQDVLVTATTLFCARFKLPGLRLFRDIAALQTVPRISTEVEDNLIYRFDQALPLPKTCYVGGQEHGYLEGAVTSASTTTIVNTAIGTRYLDDHWNNGSILLTSGSLEGVHVGITDYVRSTNTFTTDAIGGTPAVADTFYAIAPLPRPIYSAFFEIALNVARGRFDRRANQIAEGLTGVSRGGVSESFGTQANASQGGYIPPIALDLMRPFCAGTAVLRA